MSNLSPPVVLLLLHVKLWKPKIDAVTSIMKHAVFQILVGIVSFASLPTMLAVRRLLAAVRRIIDFASRDLSRIWR
jgi:hypothetical protein